MSEDLIQDVGTPEDLEDTALYLVLACGIAMGGNPKPYEMAGMAHAVITSVTQGIIKNQHEQETNSSESEIIEGVSTEPEQVSGAGEPRGKGKSAEGARKTTARKTQGNS